MLNFSASYRSQNYCKARKSGSNILENLFLEFFFIWPLRGLNLVLILLWKPRLMVYLWVASWVLFWPIFLLFFYENHLFESCNKTCMYLRYVDDNFSVFNSFEEEGAFHLKINSLRTSFWFTVELENDCAMSFSDVHLERRVVYYHHRLTFTSFYTN